MKINLPIARLKRNTIPQLQALLDTGDDWLLPETLEAVRQLLKSKQQGA